MRRPTQADDEVAEGAVIHVEDALPEDPPGIEPERVALGDVVVEHRGQQIVRGADRVHVAGEVKVDVLHRRELRVAPSGSAALGAEDGPQRRLAHRDDRAFAEPPQPVGEPDRGRRLAFPGGRRCHRGDEHERPVRAGAGALDCLPADLRLVAPVRLEVASVQPERLADRLDRLELHSAGDVDILLSHV